MMKKRRQAFSSLRQSAASGEWLGVVPGLVFRVVMFLVVFLCAWSSAGAQDVRWDESKARLAGNGCSKDQDAFVIANGSDISVIFTNLGFSLTGSDRPLAASKSCVVQLPAEIESGFYVADLSQQFLYGITKSEGSDVTMKNVASFFGQKLTSPEIVSPRGQQVNNPFMVSSRVDRFTPGRNRGWLNAWCASGRQRSGFFRSRLSVRGQRDASRENLIAFVDGLDVRYEIFTSITACPVR